MHSLRSMHKLCQHKHTCEVDLLQEFERRYCRKGCVNVFLVEQVEV